MYLYCIVVLLLYCSLKEVFCIEISNWDLKSVRFQEVSAKNCPLHRGFLRSVLWKEVSTIEDVRYREVSLYDLSSLSSNKRRLFSSECLFLYWNTPESVHHFISW